MTQVYIELSGESLDLARAEVRSVVALLGGADRWTTEDPVPFSVAEVPGERIPELGDRLALARRVLTEARHPTPHRPGESASFRRLGSPTGTGDPAVVHALASEWKSSGGRIDLRQPQRRFWWAAGSDGTEPLWEELLAVERARTSRRRISQLPFQRPVGLDPRLAKAAANLAQVRVGDRVIDPFVGTGALLAEAARLGGRTTGIDVEATMVQGAQRNFSHLGVAAERLVVGDAGEVEFDGSEGPFDALLTDPPYGRASTTRGEEAASLVRRVLPRWAARLTSTARVVVIVPGGPPVLDPPWTCLVNVPIRVHRSLTREFRVYVRKV